MAWSVRSTLKPELKGAIVTEACLPLPGIRLAANFVPASLLAIVLKEPFVDYEGQLNDLGIYNCSPIIPDEKNG